MIGCDVVQKSILAGNGIKRWPMQSTQAWWSWTLDCCYTCYRSIY